MPKKQTAPEISVIIPAYNEAKRLPHTILDMDAKLSVRPWTYEIVVVDDGSKDNTAAIVTAMSKDIPHLKVVQNTVNQGKGGVVRQGMLMVDGAYRIFTDADNSTSIDQIDRMMPLFQSGADVVIGSRRHKDSILEPAQPWYRGVLGQVSNLIIQATNVPGIWDTQCGFKGFTASAAEAIFKRTRVPGWGFDIEVLTIARVLGLKIQEMPVHWVNDTASHVKPSAYLKVFVENAKIWAWKLRGVYLKEPQAHEYRMREM